MTFCSCASADHFLPVFELPFMSIHKYCYYSSLLLLCESCNTIMYLKGHSSIASSNLPFNQYGSSCSCLRFSTTTNLGDWLSSGSNRCIVSLSQEGFWVCQTNVPRCEGSGHYYDGTVLLTLRLMFGWSWWLESYICTNEKSRESYLTSSTSAWLFSNLLKNRNLLGVSLIIVNWFDIYMNN